MTEIVLGMVMLASTAGTLPVPDTTPPVAPTPRLVLPSDLLDQQPRPLWRAEETRKTQTTTRKGSSTAAKVLGVALGGVGGFFGGAWAGYYLTQDRDNPNDDGVSGLRGLVIGAPVGAALGALLGYQIAK